MIRKTFSTSLNTLRNNISGFLWVTTIIISTKILIVRESIMNKRLTVFVFCRCCSFRWPDVIQVCPFTLTVSLWWFLTRCEVLIYVRGAQSRTGSLLYCWFLNLTLAHPTYFLFVSCEFSLLGCVFLTGLMNWYFALLSVPALTLSEPFLKRFISLLIDTMIWYAGAETHSDISHCGPLNPARIHVKLSP